MSQRPRGRMRKKAERKDRGSDGDVSHVYNDAPFSDEDWKNVLAMSNNVKNADPSAAGEFGMGLSLAVPK
ncbi:sacsin-like protein [Planoprotostelium fungivorum]|uniref:Sacsin-like protein n=1 Tax=Planoprotostelium fungivorum TaxID=1890364 RepID=A0A2P6MWB3_9EUKA|nr:sacsin-like protein [Planoprotostelium fungivorum]